VVENKTEHLDKFVPCSSPNRGRTKSPADQTPLHTADTVKGRFPQQTSSCSPAAPLEP